MQRRGADGPCVSSLPLDSDFHLVSITDRGFTFPVAPALEPDSPFSGGARLENQDRVAAGPDRSVAARGVFRGNRGDDALVSHVQRPAIPRRRILGESHENPASRPGLDRRAVVGLGQRPVGGSAAPSEVGARAHYHTYSSWILPSDSSR